MKYQTTKSILAAVGRRCPGSVIHLLNGILNYVHAGWWFKQKGFVVPATLADRKSFYRHLSGRVKEPATYLEFGVFRGDSMRMWSGLLQDSGSMLEGFDSFEGLPEDWRMAADKSTFDVKGEIPDIDDSRIRFHKGWFENTLPGFLENFVPRPQLIIHFDADLYSSTRYVINLVEPYMTPGTVLVFDELYDRDHELKALDEFLAEHPMTLECLGATPGLTQAAFRILQRA